MLRPAGGNDYVNWIEFKDQGPDVETGRVRFVKAIADHVGMTGKVDKLTTHHSLVDLRLIDLVSLGRSIFRSRTNTPVSALPEGTLVVTITKTQTATSLKKSRMTRNKHVSTDAAFRIMSETAHDLRAPLTTIRESIRVVRDGDLGTLNESQQQCLAAAINQCDCVNQMVGDMVQLERLRTGMPQAHRTWVSVTAIQESISQTLQPWVMPRKIRVIWDISAEPCAKIFADANLLRRLVVNLVANAIRVTPEGESIMIRVQPAGNESLRWSVVDQGPGISEVDLRQIANRHVSSSGGEGLGLSICRQISALHFSDLRIESRVGIGTSVSFHTAINGPVGVADLWATWRVQQQQRTDRVAQMIGPSRDRKVRIDRPVAEIQLSADGCDPICEEGFAAGSVAMGAMVSKQTLNAFDELIQSKMRMFDLVYRIDARHWAWVFDADLRAAQRRIDEINVAMKAKAPDARLTWSQTQMVPIHPQRTISRVSDLLVRQTLASAKNPNPFADVNQVRLGTAGIGESQSATRRLEAELRWLTSRVKSQASRLMQDRNRLRPPSDLGTGR